MNDTLQLKCPNCGASIGFNAQEQKFVCEYCTSEFTEEEINAANADSSTKEKTSSEEFSNNTNLYICDSCGAEIVTDENTAASFCYYCHNAVTLKGRVSGSLEPDLIIPFKLSREQAENEFHKWCQKKWFLPNSFKSQKQLEKMVGLYVPYWLADCKVDAKARFEGQISHSHRSGDYRITHTKVFDVERAARMDYARVPADASKKLDDKLMDSIEPFNYSEIEKFSMNYFSGFFADRYDVEKAEALERIKQRLEPACRSVLQSDVTGYTTVIPKSNNTRIINTNWNYAMLPVWFMTYIHNGKSYFFAINGQTGKVTGILPLSAVKVGILAVILFIIFGILGGLLGGAM